MEKIFETFARDIKRNFDDVVTVEHAESAALLDLEEYVVTENIERVIGNIAAYFFEDKAAYPAAAETARALQEQYRDRIGPGVWIRGFFGAGKSHLLNILYLLFSCREIPAAGKTVAGTPAELIAGKIRNEALARLIREIDPEEYLAFIFSANHITRSGDTILNCLPEEIARQMGEEEFEERGFSARETAQFLEGILNRSGKKRMLIFIDEILDVLDTADKVRKFEGLIELLPDRIWFIVTSLVAKSSLLEQNTAERMIHRFGQEQILYPEEMAGIVKERYLKKKEEAGDRIMQEVSLEKLKYLFAGAYAAETGDGRMDRQNLVDSYPFYPFQIAFMKEMLKNESKGSARNMMKTIKSIVKNPAVYNQPIGVFAGIDLIYEELKSKRSIEAEYSDLIESLAGSVLRDGSRKHPIKKPLVMQVLKAVVLLSQVKPEGVKPDMILPFVYQKDGIADEYALKDCLEILLGENYVSVENERYRPVTKRESDIWNAVKNISSVTESAIREFLNDRIRQLFECRSMAGRYLISGKINGCQKEICFGLKRSEVSPELPNVVSCIPLKADVLEVSEREKEDGGNKDLVFVIPNYERIPEGELYKAARFRLQLEEALNREADFGVDAKLRIQMETKRNQTEGKIQRFLETGFQYAAVCYLGQKEQNFSEPIQKRLELQCEKMLKKRYPLFLGRPLREAADSFIRREIFEKVKMDSDYLLQLGLVNEEGEADTANRHYHEYLNFFPEDGFEKDGSFVLEEFSKGRFGWELDLIKIMTALAFRSGDLRLTCEGKVYSLPDDIGELTDKNGIFCARKKEAFCACKLTRIRISDDEVRSAALLLRKIEPDLAMNPRIPDIAGIIRSFCTRVENPALWRDPAMAEREEVEPLLEAAKAAGDILSRGDDEETVAAFVKKLSSDEALKQFCSCLFISKHMEQIRCALQICRIWKDAGSAIWAQADQETRQFILGDEKSYDYLLERYQNEFRAKYAQYQSQCSELWKELAGLPEWEELTAEQREAIKSQLPAAEMGALKFSGLQALGIGEYPALIRLSEQISEAKKEAVRQIHAFCDQNESAGAGEAREEKSQPERMLKSLHDYSRGRIINLDSEDKIGELEQIWGEIKEQIIRDIRSGKRITLEL